MDCSMPGFLVHHQLPEFSQTHVHRLSDAIQPSHPLSSPSPPAPNPSQSINKKTQTPGSKWKAVLLTIVEGLSQDQIPHHASLPVYKVVGQQATKDADGITIETDVWPTYNLRRIGSSARGFGCGKLHTVGYEMVSVG